MNSPIQAALIAALFYGVGGVFMKAAHHAGASTRDYVFLASLSTLIAAALWVNGNTVMLLKNPIVVIGLCLTLWVAVTFLSNVWAVPGIWYVLPAAILLTCGFISMNHALSMPTGLASVVLVITSSNPLLATTLSLLFLNEAKKVNLAMLIPGALLVITGTVLVSLSIKSH